MSPALSPRGPWPCGRTPRNCEIAITSNCSSPERGCTARPAASVTQSPFSPATRWCSSGRRGRDAPHGDFDMATEGFLKIGITCYPSVGGSGVVASALGTELAQRGHESHFVSYGRPFRPPEKPPRV